MTMRLLTVLLGLLTLVAYGRVASADNLTVGVFAPGEPFAGSSPRLELTTRLANHFGAAVGVTGVGRAFARGSDLASAVKRGEVQVAVVDATFLGSLGTGYTVLAQATRDGATSHAWQLVTRGGERSLRDLRGKRVLIAALGARERDVVLLGLLRGEVPATFFAGIDTATDTASALAALGLGKADVALVPPGTTLPSGVTRVLTVGAMPGPMLVAFGSMPPERKVALTEAATNFRGDGVISGFRAASGDPAKAWVRRLVAPNRRGPMVVPTLRVVVTDLLGERDLELGAADLRELVAPPVAPTP